ncbi:MAG: DUF1697 domain-containing protein, partial [Actinomycetota bacterium]
MRVAIFLRAINTGDRRVTNAELIESLRGADLTDVSAFQAAGNLLATADDVAVADIVAAVESAIFERFGFRSEAFVRTSEQLATTVAGVPFSDDQLAATEGRVQVTFLGEEPTDEVRSAVADLVPADD